MGPPHRPDRDQLAKLDVVGVAEPGGVEPVEEPVGTFGVGLAAAAARRCARARGLLPRPRGRGWLRGDTVLLTRLRPHGRRDEERSPCEDVRTSGRASSREGAPQMSEGRECN
jgi:hypothetical protein